MKDYAVVWSNESLADLRTIIDYLISAESPVAEQITNAILEAGDSLEKFPNRGRRVPELRQLLHPNIREIIHQSWRLIYEILEAEVHILMVVDSRRDLSDTLLELLMRSRSASN